MSEIHPKSCEHIKAVEQIKVSKGKYCEECAKIKNNWVHLRVCQTCGVTLCCDSSKNKHMTKHFHKTGHTVITSAEFGERWMWCYEHEVFVPY